MFISIIWGLILSTCYVLACFGLGAVVISALTSLSKQPVQKPTLAWALTSFVLGMGIIANIWQLLALAAWFKHWLIIVLCVICLAAGTRFLIQARPILLSRIAFLWKEMRKDHPFWRFLAFLVLSTILVSGLSSSIFPLDGDAVAFYLSIAKVTAASQRLAPLPGSYESLSQIGLQGEFHYAAMLALGSLPAAKFILWYASIAAAGLLAAFAGRAGLSRRGQWITLALLYTSSAFSFLVTGGKTDLFAAALAIAAIYWALRLNETQNKVPLRLVGMLTGLAIIAKITYAAAFFPCILLLVIFRRLLPAYKQSRSTFFKSAFLTTLLPLGVWMLIAALPHILKSLVLFGNPLAPLLSSPGSESTFSIGWYSPKDTRRLLLTYPLAITFGRYKTQSGTLTPFVLAFLPLIFFQPRVKDILKSPLFHLSLSALFGVLCWMLFFPSIMAPRYFLPPLLTLIPFAAGAADWITVVENRPRLLSAGVWICLVAALLTSESFLVQIKTIAETSRALISGADITCLDAHPSCAPLQLVDPLVGPGERVFLASDPRFWLRDDILQCASRRKEHVTMFNIEDPAQRWGYLFDRGFRVIVIDSSSHILDNDALDPAQAPSWLKPILIVKQAGYRVYRLESTDSTLQPLVSCQQIYPPAWDLVYK